jgi:hypothetical protein
LPDAARLSATGYVEAMAQNEPEMSRNHRSGCNRQKP